MNTPAEEKSLILRQYKLRHLPVKVDIALGMAEFGFSAKAILKETGITQSVLSYRLKQFGIRLADYREARSTVANAVITGTKKSIARMREEVQLKIAEKSAHLGFVIDI